MAGIVKDIYQGYFALVMATGICPYLPVFLIMVIFADVLFFINVCAYSVLILFIIARLCRYFSLVLRDLTHHQSGPGFFTTIAGTCVLGSQCNPDLVSLPFGFFYGSLAPVSG